MSDTRQALADSVDRTFASAWTTDAVVAAEGEGAPESAIAATEALGLDQVHALAEAGGGWQDAAVVFKALGRHAVPIPLAETIVANWLVRRAGLDAPAAVRTLAATPADAELDAERGLSATLSEVPGARLAEEVVVTIPGGSGLQVARFARADAELQARSSLAGEARDTLVYRSARALEAREVALPPNSVEVLMAATRAAQIAGALEAVLQIAVYYAGEREQFGRPIGRFQAIQQELARLAGEVAAAGVAADLALRALDEKALAQDGVFGAPEDPGFDVAVAKVTAGEAAETGPRIAHQVLGAIGFTYEHRLHLFTRRLWAWRAEYGTASAWAGRLGQLALHDTDSDLWARLTAR